MARRLLIISIFALLAALVSADRAAPTFVPRRSSNQNYPYDYMKTALQVRGGDHLDPTDTAKIGTILAGIHAALTLMSPSRMLEVYGAKATPYSEFFAQWQGMTILSFCLQAWSLIVKKSTLQESTVVNYIPWTIMQYKTFWNEDHKKLGYPVNRQFLGAVLAPLALYACATDAPYASLLIKACAIYVGGNGVFFVLSPGAACGAYGIEANDANKADIKTLGFTCFGAGIFQSLVAFSDVDPVRAFGFAWIPALIMQLTNSFVTKAPSYAWALVDLIVVLVCGLQIG